MRSSTSSSDARLWRRTWAAALVLVLLAFAGWEGFWRWRGFRPSVNEGETLWALERDKASNGDPRRVVLVGSSRMQLAIDPDAFTAVTGWPRPLQLGIAMGPSLPILRDLAEDPGFSGLVICEVNPLLFFESRRMMDFISVQHVRHHRQLSIADVVGQELRLLVERALVSRLPELSPTQLRRAFERGRWPRPNHIRFSAERFWAADFDRLDDLELRNRATARRRASWNGVPFGDQELPGFADFVAGLVRPIRARGGEVVFVRLPASRHILADERRRFPRERYWDVFAARIPALAIHFEDYPALAHFDPPDGGHLDQDDATAFSRALGEILVRELAARGESRPK